MNLAAMLWGKKTQRSLREKKKKCFEKLTIIGAPRKTVSLNRQNGNFINMGTNKDLDVRYNTCGVETCGHLQNIGIVTNISGGKVWPNFIEPEGNKDLGGFRSDRAVMSSYDNRQSAQLCWYMQGVQHYLVI